MSGSVESEANGAVRTLWLNRPQAENAYDLDLLDALATALARVEEDEESRVVVIRGRGDSFCAGADVSMLAGEVPWSDLGASVSRIFKRISESRRITIAAVHGWTVGGGFELMLACDLALAAENARIGDFHIRHGLFAGAGTIYRLPRLIGLRKARELMLSARSSMVAKQRSGTSSTTSRRWLSWTPSWSASRRSSATRILPSLG